LKSDSFVWADPPANTSDGGQYYRIPVGGGEVIGRKGRGRLDGKEYATITFSKLLVPKQAGTFRIEPGTVACEALVGYRDARRDRFDGFFDDFFSDSFFGRRRRGIYRRVDVASNPLKLHVRPLPTEGRPDGFAGHVGRFAIETAASPRKVNVGDPITLTLRLRGPQPLERIALPPLREQADLASGFRVPEEMAPGKVEGGVKVFTQTLRALRADVSQIPALSLPYFDPREGVYRVARSEPIPVEVAATRIVTASDAEGREPMTAAGRALEAWTRGIAHNFEGLDVLEDQRYGLSVWRRPGRLALLVGAPLGYLLLLAGVTLDRRRRANPAAVRARRALTRCVAALSGRSGKTDTSDVSDETARVLSALRGYLGDKLDLAPGALTLGDVRDRLARRGAGDARLAELEALFAECEAGRYAGGAVGARGALRDRALALVRGLEKVLK
jgi:hypothetical protein